MYVKKLNVFYCLYEFYNPKYVYSHISYFSFVRKICTKNYTDLCVHMSFFIHKNMTNVIMQLFKIRISKFKLQYLKYFFFRTIVYCCFYSSLNFFARKNVSYYLQCIITHISHATW